MIPKKIYLNYEGNDYEYASWSEEPLTVLDCVLQNRAYIDLSQVWHGIEEAPQPNRIYIAQIGDSAFDTFYDSSDWKNYSRGLNLKRWAYIEDLLPEYSAKEHPMLPKLELLKEIAREYPRKTIENIITQIESRINN